MEAEIRDVELRYNEIVHRRPLHNDVSKFFPIFGIMRCGGDKRTMVERHLQRFVIERHPNETQRAAHNLVGPNSTALMKDLTTYMALMMSNDLVTDENAQAFLAKAEELHHIGKLTPLFSQGLPSARAVTTRLLHAAVRMNATNFLRQALKYGADVESPSMRERSLTLLQVALEGDQYEVARILIDAGANVKAGVSGANVTTGVSGRCSEEDCDMCSFDVGSIICYCASNAPSQSVTLAAQSKTCIGLIPELMRNGATIPKSNPVLTYAIDSGASVEILNCLIDAGADINLRTLSKDRRADNPLSAAVRRGSLTTVRILLEAGADPNCSFRLEPGETIASKLVRDGVFDAPLDLAIKGRRDCDDDTYDIVRILLDYDADPNGSLSMGSSLVFGPDLVLDGLFNSPLLTAILLGKAFDDYSYNIIGALLEAGADPNISALDFLSGTEHGTRSISQSVSEVYERRIREEQESGYEEYDYVTDYELRGTQKDKKYYDMFSCYPHVTCFPLYPLQAAVELDDMVLVELLLKYRATTNSAYGTPALALAISQSNMEMARLLLRKGADPNGLSKQPYCQSALEAAVDKDDLAFVDLLLQFGAHVNNNPAPYGGRTPLQRAAENGRQKMIEHLLESGASMLSKPALVQGASCLDGFVRNGLHSYIPKALEAGASPNGSCIAGSSPLLAAVTQNDVVSLTLLLDAGANIHEYAYVAHMDRIDPSDEQGPAKILLPSKLSPLQWAAVQNHVEIAQMLYEAGADINQPPHFPHGETALYLATKNNNFDVARYLLKQNAEVGTYSNGKTALLAAVKEGCKSVLNLLLEYRANPNQPCYSISNLRLELGDDHDGWGFRVFPLDNACSFGRAIMIHALVCAGADTSKGYAVRNTFEVCNTRWDKFCAIIEVLLQYDVDINRRQTDDSTALQEAILCEDFNCADRLIKAGAYINAPASEGKEGRTALQAAVEVGNVDMVERLLLDSADVNAPAAPDHGVTALQAAAIKGYFNIAKLLLEHGAVIGAAASPKNGCTAINGAAEFGRIDMVKLLLDNYHGPSPISELRDDAYRAAKKGNQWFVMELLDAYKHPDEVSP
jgi:ankyrin repeat protein